MPTPKERFVTALEGGQVDGRVPHFELVFFLTMEAFGKVHPSHRDYGQWDQMEEKERQLHREDQADIFLRTAQKYEHDAIFLHVNPGRDEEFMRVMDIIRERTGDRYFLMMHGDATYGMPHGDNMVEFSVQMAERADELKEQAQKRVDRALERAETFADHGALDGYALCADYCFNSGPFFSPDQFAEFVTPYLKQLIDGYRELGLYSIKHTDGNIMPILDQLVGTGPDALHSLDPQGGVDLAEVKRLHGEEVCLIGNVNCGKLDTGTEDDVVESARYALEKGMPEGGYIFSSSNCIYTGMRLSRYELMLDVWREYGNYNGG